MIWFSANYWCWKMAKRWARPICRESGLSPTPESQTRNFLFGVRCAVTARNHSPNWLKVFFLLWTCSKVAKRILWKIIRSHSHGSGIYWGGTCGFASRTLTCKVGNSRGPTEDGDNSFALHSYGTEIWNDCLLGFLQVHAAFMQQASPNQH